MEEYEEGREEGLEETIVKAIAEIVARACHPPFPIGGRRISVLCIPTGSGER